MHTDTRSPATRSLGSQRGAVAVMGGIWLMISLLMLMALDIGNVFWQKREVQKIADLAALAGAQTVNGDPAGAAGACPGTASADASANAGRNGMLAGDSLSVRCGNWNPRDSRGPADAAATPPRYFRAESGLPLNAVHVTLSRTVPYLFIFDFSGGGTAPSSRTVVAEASATRTSPMAMLMVRNTLVSVDSSKSVVLNALYGGLLGGSLNVDAIGWNGLLQSQIGLLEYVEQLRTNLNLDAGQFDQVLETGLSTGQLLQAAIDVMQRSGATAAASVTALQAIRAAALAGSAAPLLKLGDILNVQTGTPASGLDTQLQLFQLVQGVVQLANGQNAAVAGVPLSLPGLVNSQVSVQVIEPAQPSALGNPLLAKAAPQGPDAIFVRTAQIRTMASIDLSGVAGKVADIGNAALTALAPLTSAVDSVLNLQLVSAVQQVLGSVVCPLLAPCPEYKALYTRALPARVDVSLEVGNASAWVTDYNCTNLASKSLTSNGTTPIAELRVGRISNPFASKSRPSVDAVELVEIGYTVAKPSVCLLAVLCTGWQWKQANGTWGLEATGTKTVIAGLGAKIGSTAVAQGQAVTLMHEAVPPENLPELTVPFAAADPSYHRMSSTDLVSQVGNTLGTAEVKLYSSPAAGVLGSVMNIVGSTLNSLISTVQGLVASALAPLLDPLLDQVLKGLGIDLNEAAIGARLSCNSSVELVY